MSRLDRLCFVPLVSDYMQLQRLQAKGVQERLERALSSGERFEKATKIFVWGTGLTAQDLLSQWSGPDICGIFDNDPSKWGTELLGITVRTIEELKNLEPESVAFILAISLPFQEEVVLQLKRAGFNLEKHRIDGRVVSPVLAPRLALPLRAGVTPLEAFQRMSVSGIRYCLLWPRKDLFELEAADFDVLLHEQDLERLVGLNLFDLTAPTRIYEFDFFITSFFREDVAPTFPRHMEASMLANAFPDSADVKTLSPLSQLEALVFRTIFHKPQSAYIESGNRELSPKTTLFFRINEYAKLAGIGKFHRPEELWGFLYARGLIPPLDFARKLEQNANHLGPMSWLRRNPLKARRFAPNQEILLFVVRSEVESHDIPLLVSIFESLGPKLIASRALSSEEATFLKSRTRGGVWAESERSRKAGLPIHLLVFLDSEPSDPEPSHLVEHPYLGNRIYGMKQHIRREFAKARGLDVDIPPLLFHSPDDEREAFEYASLLGGDFVSSLWRGNG